MQLTLFTTHKRCTGCGQTKPLTDYHGDKSKRDGRRSKCKTCVSLIDRKRRETNPERHRMNARRWQQANYERNRNNSRRWQQANRDITRKYDRTRYSKRYKSNPEYYYELNRRRRARKAATVPQRWRRSECPNHLCYWCGTEITPDTTHVDHIMPLSLGGPHTPENTASTCAPCNLAKHNKHPLVWIAQLVTDN
jgi:5-methylcytosine-specific restriction endonuclease McrA